MGWSRKWQARWIWVADEAVRRPKTFFQLDDRGRRPNTVAFLRAELDLETPPASAPCRLTSDGRYQLFVNGAPIGRGPVRGEPVRLRWDEHDLAPALRPGRNVLGVIVRNYGVPTLYYKSARPAGDLGASGGLLLEVELDGLLFCSDSRWRAALAPYARADPKDWAGAPAAEIIDGTAYPFGWSSPDFDASSWRLAVELLPSGLGIGSPEPPSDPFGMLDVSPIGQLSERLVRPTAAIARGEAGAPGGHPLNAREGDAAGSPLEDRSVPAVVAGCEWVTLDFGEITNSHPVLTVEAERGTVVDLAVGEDLGDDGRPVIAPRNWTMRYVTAGQRTETIEALDPVGFRYLQLAVRSDSPATVHLAARFRHYPRPAGPFFSCDDSVLNELWLAGARTLDACSTDAFLDCPGREQRAWVGDAYVETLVSLVANPDPGLVRRNAELAAEGVRSDGLRPPVGGGDFSDLVATLPDFSLHWIRTLARIHERLGEVELIEQCWPRVLDALAWFEWHRGEDGLLVDLTGWIWVDWAQTERRRNIAAVDALYALALDDAAALAEVLDEGGSARRLRARAERSKGALERYYDPTRGVYVDAADPHGPASRRVSQQTNTLAILTGVVSPERIDRILDYVLDPARLVMTRHPGDGGPQAERLSYHFRPAQRFGGGGLMDEAREVVLAQPFFCHFLHQALAGTGRFDLLLASIRRWEALLARGNRVFEEYWDHVPGHGSRCHGWSATPTYDLTTHVLGVSPADTAWRSVRIAPFFGVLDALSGSVPTPHGSVEIDLRRGGGGTLTLPQGTTGTFAVEGSPPVSLRAGRQQVDC